MTGRTVHARDYGGGIEVVRYDKAGKWFVEIKENVGRNGLPAERFAYTVAQAAEAALSFEKRGGTTYTGLPGGATFDRLVAR